jgi:hypothetical protein
MATPHVAGAAALLLSKFPSMATKQLVSIIEKSVDTLPALQGLVKTGGRLNINKMMDNVRFVRFYNDNYYYGAFSDGLLEGDYTMTDLENLGCENDSARSVIIPEDYTVQMFEDDNFGGTYWLVDRNSLDSAEFSYIGADYTVSSVKIRNGVTFYQDSWYGGTSTNGLHEGNYTLAQLQSYGFVDNWASSVSIPEGYTVKLYENDNFSGTCWTLDQNDEDCMDFLNIGCNDAISSVKVIRNY